MADLFDNLEAKAKRAGVTHQTRDSQRWFRNATSRMGQISHAAILNNDRLKKQSKALIGQMVFFCYAAKHRATLPYYDRFPLAVILGPANNGFLGLNFHYLPPIYRAKLLDSLMRVASNREYDETTRLQVSYEIVKSLSKTNYYKPCVKHYLSNRVASQFAKVDVADYEMAVFLPTSSWWGASEGTVYRDSRKRIT